MSIARSHRFNPKAWMAVLLAVLLLVPPVAMAEDEKGPTTPEAKKEEIKRRPLLWRVDTNPPIYLYGTIHVNDERVTKHLPVVQQAIDQSTAVYTELAMDPAGMMAMQQAILKRAPLPEGQTLKALFGDELFERTSKVMPPGTPLFALNGFKPWLVMFMLIQTQMAEHQKQRAKEAKEAGEKPQDPNAESLDPMIFNNARKQGKKVGGLETIDTQIDAFDNIPLEKQVEMVKDSVEAIEKARKKAKGEAVEGDDEEEPMDSLGKMVDMWLAGDDVGFAKLFEEDLRKQGGDAADFVEALLDKRNVGMVKELLRLREADPKQVYFIAVGAGHMPGPKGIVKLLEEKGHKVERIELGQKLPAIAKEPAKAPAEKEPAGAGAGG